ncbi:MAG: type II toxin-antitoxin system Phd/YefM family antitoxin [Polaromonas sp.]|nr:type II toxin-antitoxin system Phd/YefM family antitoxin [Polaromonas sp.]
MSMWQLQEAKSKFSDVVKRAQSEGPQGITVRGESVAVLVSRADYARLAQPKPRFAEFMQRSPLVGVDLDTSRQADLTREIAL